MLTVLGMMSGTSLDGVDAAVLATDGETVGAFGPTRFRPYADGERALLRRALAEARRLVDRTARPGALAEAEAVVTAAHADVAAALIAELPAGTRIDVVGFHGQTVFHAPAQRLTVQIGDGAALAARLGLPVVHDFRAADVAAGGQGAPFVPAYHRALAIRDAALPVAVVNIGGVGNVTWIGEGGRLLAFDTGPGNAPLDDFVRARTGAAMDAGGRLAAAGRADEAALAGLLAHPYFALPAPKSLDRDMFPVAEAVAGLGTADGAATLTAFTARSIAAGVARAGGAGRIVVCGGGAHNPTLLAMLAEASGAEVTTAAAMGWSVDFMEAQAFAFLAARSVAGLPLSYPETTGVPRPMPGGVLARP